MHPLRQELSFVLDLVERCSAIALDYRAAGSGALQLRHKPKGGGPVTAADRELNERIVGALTERFPDDAILAEESPRPGDAWQRADRCWYVDPIDGTQEFARGSSGWTVQLGLCIGGTPALGVVAEPSRARLSWGVVYQGYRETGQRVEDEAATPLQTSDRPLPQMHLIGGRPHPYSRQQAIRRALGVPRSRSAWVGSVGVRMTAVARGEADAYVQAPGRVKLWDTCGPTALVLAAGGTVTDLQGAPLDFRSPQPSHARGVVASHGGDHQAILERLAALVRPWLDAQGSDVRTGTRS